MVSTGSQVSVESQLMQGSTPALDQEAARLLTALSAGRYRSHPELAWLAGECSGGACILERHFPYLGGCKSLGLLPHQPVSEADTDLLGSETFCRIWIWTRPYKLDPDPAS